MNTEILGTAILNAKPSPRRKIFAPEALIEAVITLVKAGIKIHQIVTYKYENQSAADSIKQCLFSFGDIQVNTQRPDMWIANDADEEHVRKALKQHTEDSLTFKILILGKYCDMDATLMFEWIALQSQ